MAVLRDQDDSLPLCHRNIYNLTAAFSRAKWNGRSPPEALIAHLEEEKVAGRVCFEYRCDESGHIAMPFVADLRSVKYFGRHGQFRLRNVAPTGRTFRCMVFPLLFSPTFLMVLRCIRPTS